jgi:hypothetical protein
VNFVEMDLPGLRLRYDLLRDHQYIARAQLLAGLLSARSG